MKYPNTALLALKEAWRCEEFKNNNCYGSATVRLSDKDVGTLWWSPASGNHCYNLVLKRGNGVVMDTGYADCHKNYHWKDL